MARSKPKRKKKTIKPTKFNLIKAVEANKKRLIELCKGVGCDITDKLTSMDFTLIYIDTIQIHGPKAHPDYKINPKVVSSLKRSVKLTLYNKMHSPIKPADIKISLVDLYLIEGLITYIERHIETDDQRKEELLNDISFIKEYYGDRDFHHNIKERMICLFIKKLTFASRNIYTLHNEQDTSHQHKLNSCSEYYLIKKHQPEKKHFNINNKWRPAFKLQQPEICDNTGDMVIEDCLLKAELLNGIYQGNKSELEVYIQSHAIDRIWERLYPINILSTNQLIYQSIAEDPKIITYKNSLLVEVNIQLGKIGYFVAEIIDDCMVLKTFLLLSGISTPEGAKFKKAIGFNKFDYKYWDFDILITFVNNEMNKDNPLYSYFEQAGMLHLFELTPDYFKNNGTNYEFSGELDWHKLDDYINNTTDKEALSKEELDCVEFSEMLR